MWARFHKWTHVCCAFIDYDILIWHALELSAGFCACQENVLLNIHLHLEISERGVKLGEAGLWAPKLRTSYPIHLYTGCIDLCQQMSGTMSCLWSVQGFSVCSRIVRLSYTKISLWVLLLASRHPFQCVGHNTHNPYTCSQCLAFACSKHSMCNK